MIKITVFNIIHSFTTFTKKIFPTKKSRSKGGTITMLQYHIIGDVFHPAYKAPICLQIFGKCKVKSHEKKKTLAVGLMHIIYLAKAIYIIILHNSSQVIFNIIISAFNGMDRHLLIQYFASENCPNKGHRIML